MSTNVKKVGIYSFPKSGNTWVRNLLQKALNFECVTEIPDIYSQGPLHGTKISNKHGEILSFYKSHDLLLREKYHGHALNHFGVIYVVRHPLDVFMSQLNFALKFEKRLNDRWSAIKPVLLQDCDDVQDVIRRGHFDDVFSAFMTFGTLAPYFIEVGSWHVHTSHWANPNTNVPVKVIRYEDMIQDTAGVLEDIVNFLNLETIFSAGEVVKHVENQSEDGGKFYWSKISGNYRKYLTEAQIGRFREVYKPYMDKFFYE